MFQKFFLLFFPFVNSNNNRKSYSFVCLIFIPLSLQTNRNISQWQMLVERKLLCFNIHFSFCFVNHYFFSLSFDSMITIFLCLSQNQNLTSFPICNGLYGNRTEWSPIWSLITRVINKIGPPRHGSPICLITSMITDQIGWHELLLQINRNFNKISLWYIRLFLKSKRKKFQDFLASNEKKSYLNMHVMVCTVQLLRHDAYCPIKAEIRAVDNQSDLNILLKFWLRT